MKNPNILFTSSMLGIALRLAVPTPAQTPLTTVPVATGLTLPLFVTAPRDDPNRLFIVEQREGSTGYIKILNLKTGVLNATPFLTIAGLSTGSEQGLLGLAFDPNYANNGYLYVDYTDGAGNTQIRRFTVSGNPDSADPNSVQRILSVAQPFTNHNGGWLAFGPDGYLYIGMGDGGSAGDPGNRAQNPSLLLGKLLRIDVHGDAFPADPNRNYAIPPSNPFAGGGGAGEVWAYGLRNPWRCSFDRLTGDLYVGDVGQGAWEEVDFQPAASPGGENYGWRCYEGNFPYDPNGCAAPAGMVFPIEEYNHSGGKCAIVGGYVYRGNGICDLHGTYFFAELCTNQIWSFEYVGGQVTNFQERTTELAPSGGPAITTITSFGEDARGELYIVSQAGSVFKIIPRGPQKGDLNNDGLVSFADINAFVLAIADPVAYAAAYGVPAAQAGDLNCDGVISFADINPFVRLLAGI